MNMSQELQRERYSTYVGILEEKLNATSQQYKSHSLSSFVHQSAASTSRDWGRQLEDGRGVRKIRGSS